MKVKVTQSCPTFCNPMDYSPWNSPGKNTEVGSLPLLQGIFPTQGSNPGLPHFEQTLYPLSHQGSPTNLDSILKNRNITWPTNISWVKAMGFSSSHVWMWELDHKEGWVPKNWCFWTVVLEKTLKGPLDCKEIKPVSPKGNQPWILIRRTDAEAEALGLWPPDAKNWVTGKDPDAG